MPRKRWIDIGHSILLATALLVAAAVAALSPESGWWVMAGPVLLALTLVVADMLAARLRGERRAPSRSAAILGSSIFAACAIVALVDPKRVDILIPVLGACIAISVGKEREKC